MKKVIVFFAALLCLSFTGQETGKFCVQQFNTKKLMGKWRLCDYRDSLLHLSFSDLSDCSRKETIVFTDSIMKRMTYSYFQNKCHKEAEVCPYTIESRKLKYYTIETRHHNGPLHLAIVTLNDTLLKLRIVYSAYTEGQYMSYKKVVK